MILRDIWNILKYTEAHCAEGKVIEWDRTNLLRLTAFNYFKIIQRWQIRTSESTRNMKKEKSR